MDLYMMPLSHPGHGNPVTPVGGKLDLVLVIQGVKMPS